MRFYVDYRSLIEAAALPDEDYFFSVLRENNESALVLNDNVNYRLVVECENQPRDMPIFNIFWKKE